MKIPKWSIVLGLAMGLPSSILAICFIVYQLVQAELISEPVGLIVIVAFIVNSLYLMMRYASKK